MPSSKNNSDIQYKAAPQGTVNLDEAQGIVECFVAGIGNKDSVGDVCAPGAFGKSLTRRKPRVVWGHNWNDPIGKVLDMYEVPPSDPRLPAKMRSAGIGGLYARVQFNLMSEKGREAFANVAFFGEEQEWSIGYKTINAKFDPQMQANILYEVELYEVSPVLHGANQLTGTISVKSEEQPASVSIIDQQSAEDMSVHELSSVLEALKSVASIASQNEKCGPGMMPMGMPTGGPGMPSQPSPAQMPTSGPAPRNVVKPEIPSMPENPMLVAIRRELAARTGSNIIVRSATENTVVFDRILSDGTSSTYRLPFHYAGNEFMFGKPEKVNTQTVYTPEVPAMPGTAPQMDAYMGDDAFESGKSLISFDSSSWGSGFNQPIPAQSVDTTTLNNAINNLQKILEEKSTYVIPVDVEYAFDVKQAIDPVLDYYNVDASVTEDGIVFKSLNDDFLEAIDVATKGVLRSIGNMIDRAVDRPHIGDGHRDRHDMNPNLMARSRGIGSRGAVVRLRDGSMWDPKNAPDRNNNGIVGEGLFDGRGLSLAQPDPTPDGPNSIRGPKTPNVPNAPKPAREVLDGVDVPKRREVVGGERIPKGTTERLSSGKYYGTGDWDDHLEPEERARQMGREWMGGPIRPSRRRNYPESTATYSGGGLTSDEQTEVLDSVKDSSNELVKKLLADFEKNGRLSDKQWEVLKRESKKSKKKPSTGYVSNVQNGGTVAPGARLDGGNVDLVPDHVNDKDYENLRDVIEKAMRANQMIRFDYSGKNREIIPVKIEKNNQTGKWNLTGQDNTGARKLFSLDKMSPFSGADEDRLSSGREYSGSDEAIKAAQELMPPSVPEWDTFASDEEKNDALDEFRNSVLDFADDSEAIARDILGDDEYNRSFGGAVPYIEELAKGSHHGGDVEWGSEAARDHALKLHNDIVNRLIAEGEDTRLSSGSNVDFDKTGASGYREMRHVKRTPYMFDSQDRIQKRNDYEKLVAEFKKNNGFFMEVPQYAGDDPSLPEEWYRGREFAWNVAELAFMDDSAMKNISRQYFDAPGKPSKKDFMDRKLHVDYQSWYMTRTPFVTGMADSVLNSDQYSAAYKEGFVSSIRGYLYTKRPDRPSFEDKDSLKMYERWAEQAGIGPIGRYGYMSTERFSSGQGGMPQWKQDGEYRSYENKDDLAFEMFQHMFGMSEDEINNLSTEDIADAVRVRPETIESMVDGVKGDVISAKAEYESYLASMPDMTDEQLAQMADDYARAESIGSKFDLMTDEEAADFAAYLDEERWRDVSEKFSSGEKEPEWKKAYEDYKKTEAEFAARRETMTPEEADDYYRQLNEDHREDSRLSSGGPRSTQTGERFPGRDGYGHYFHNYDPEDDFVNIDEDIAKALLDSNSDRIVDYMYPKDWYKIRKDGVKRPYYFRESGRKKYGAGAEVTNIEDLPLEELKRIAGTEDLRGQTLVRRADEVGSNARRVAEAVANNTISRPRLNSNEVGREDILHFRYNGKYRSVYPEYFGNSKKGVAYFVAWDETADNGQGAYRSFNVHQIEGLVSDAISPNDDFRSIGAVEKAAEISSRGLPSSISELGRGRLSSGEGRGPRPVGDTVKYGFIEDRAPSYYKDSNGTWIEVGGIDNYIIDSNYRSDIYPSGRTGRYTVSEIIDENGKPTGKYGASHWAFDDWEGVYDDEFDYDYNGDVGTFDSRDEAFDAVRQHAKERGMFLGSRWGEDPNRTDDFWETDLPTKEEIDATHEASYQKYVAEREAEWLAASEGRLSSGGKGRGRKNGSKSTIKQSPWSEEDRQRFADRNILRSKKRPGKRNEGPSANEFSSGAVKLNPWIDDSAGGIVDVTMEADEIHGQYSIGMGDDGKYYITRIDDAFREGGQYANETEYPDAFNSLDEAKKFAENDYRGIVESLAQADMYDDSFAPRDESDFSSGAKPGDDFNFSDSEMEAFRKAQDYADEYGDWEKLPEGKRKEYIRDARGDEELARLTFNGHRDMANDYDEGRWRMSSGGTVGGKKFERRERSRYSQAKQPAGWKAPKISDDGEILEGPFKGYYLPLDKHKNDGIKRDYIPNSWRRTLEGQAEVFKIKDSDGNDMDYGDLHEGNISSEENIAEMFESSKPVEMAQFGDEFITYGNDSRGGYDPQNDYEEYGQDDEFAPVENLGKHVGKVARVNNADGSPAYYGIVIDADDPSYDAGDHGGGSMSILITHDANGKKLDNAASTTVGFQFGNGDNHLTNNTGGSFDEAGPDGGSITIHDASVSDETVQEALDVSNTGMIAKGAESEWKQQKDWLEDYWKYSDESNDLDEKYFSSRENVSARKSQLEKEISELPDRIANEEKAIEIMQRQDRERYNRELERRIEQRKKWEEEGLSRAEIQKRIDRQEEAEYWRRENEYEEMRREGALPTSTPYSRKAALEKRLQEAQKELDLLNGDDRFSSGKFAPDGESNSRFNRRLSSGDVKGPPPTGSEKYNRSESVQRTMSALHSKPGNAVVDEDTVNLLGPAPRGFDSHVLNSARAMQIIANPDGEYNADEGWPVDAGNLLDFVTVNGEGTLREIGDAERIGTILGVSTEQAQQMLDGKPVYINSSSAIDMLDRMTREKMYPGGGYAVDDVARIWGFDAAPKWVRHSDIATPEFDLDENDMVNWSKVKWEGLSRAEFDAELKKGTNPPEPVFVSPVEYFNGDAIASNPKWDSRAGSLKNPTNDEEFTASKKKLGRTEQLQPKRFASQKRAGEGTVREDKEFLREWKDGAHGVSAANLMDILGLEREGTGDSTTTNDIRNLLREINKIKSQVPGLALAAEKDNGTFNPQLESTTKKMPITDEILNALIVSGRFKSMKEVVAAIGNPRLDSLAAEFDSRMATDAAFVRVYNHLAKVGMSDKEKAITKLITSTVGRKGDMTKRVTEGRASIRGRMVEDSLIGDEKISEIVDAANEVLRSKGMEEIDKDTMFPKDESGGFVENLSSRIPGESRMSSGQRYVTRTASSRRAQAMEDAAERRQSTGGRMSSGALPLRDETGKINIENIRTRAIEATAPEGLIGRKSATDNLSDLEKAVISLHEISKLFAVNDKNTPGFSIYDYEDELAKAGFTEDEITDVIDKIVDLDLYIGAATTHFEEAREKMSDSIEQIHYTIEKVNKLKADRESVIKKWGVVDEEGANDFASSYDDKIAKLLDDIDKMYQDGIGGESGRTAILSDDADRIVRLYPSGNTPYAGRRQNIAFALTQIEAEITKLGGRKKPVPVTGIDFGVPDGTRLSSGKTEEYFQNLTGHLISMIEKSQKEGGKWEAPWHKVSNLPKNASTKNMYSGGNLFTLMLAAEEKGYDTPHWAGFQQWKKLGGSVKKGEKGTLILLPTPMYGEIVDSVTGEKKRVTKGVYFKTAHVFNLDQVEGIDREEFLKSPVDLLSPEQKVQKLEDAIKEVGAVIQTGDGSRAFYRPSEDKVVMPPFELFKSPEDYYATLAHELVHWTGHSSRLDRPNMNTFGSPEYAREELVAEFGSAFLLAMFGLSATPREDHAHYLANWLQVLRDEPNALQDASVKAQAAAKMLIEKMQTVLEAMGEATADAESDVDVKSLQNFVDALYSVKDAYTGWASDPFNGPHFIKSLSDRAQSSGLVNRSWERIAETAIFLERLSREK